MPTDTEFSFKSLQKWTKKNLTTHHDAIEAYNEFLKSPQLCENFFLLPVIDQKNLYRRISKGKRITEIGAYAALQVRVMSESIKIAEKSSKYVGNLPVSKLVSLYLSEQKDIDTDELISFQDKLEEFQNYQIIVSRTNSRVGHIASLYSNSAHYLANMYGHKHVLEVIEQWMNLSKLYSLNAFIHCVENWTKDPLFQEMPLEWVLEVMDDGNDDYAV